MREAITALRPNLVAVDEAHCVSSWGHDFRPDHLRLGELLAGLDRARVVALRASAARFFVSEVPRPHIAKVVRSLALSGSVQPDGLS